MVLGPGQVVGVPLHPNGGSAIAALFLTDVLPACCEKFPALLILF